jgi:hypothetical protein
MPQSRSIVLTLALAAAYAVGCAGPPLPVVTYRYFVEARPGDVWYDKIRDWQQRENATRPEIEDALRGPGDDDSGLLRKKFAAFAGEERRRLAERFVAWAHGQALKHYRIEESPDLETDAWPTSQELFVQNGDDCDGIDLIAYNLMLELGFREDEIFRAVVRRDRDGEFHMVTLWFEDPADPWVVDTTGAMTMRLRRVSELPGWTVAVVFNGTTHYTARKIETWSELSAR